MFERDFAPTPGVGILMKVFASSNGKGKFRHESNCLPRGGNAPRNDRHRICENSGHHRVGNHPRVEFLIEAVDMKIVRIIVLALVLGKLYP